MFAIEVEALAKRYGDTVAVAEVTFEVKVGEIFGLLGPNGAGKTTTMECVQGLTRPDSGRVRVLGLDPQQDPAALRRRVGSQLQDSALPDRLKVWEALDLFASLTPHQLDWRTLADQWGLSGKAKLPFAKLSGGERQRLFVALALINRPEVVFLDEMTQGLDPAGRRVAWDLIRAARDRGSTIVLVTHHMQEAQELCDRLAIVHHGRVVANGTPREVTALSGKPTRVWFTAEDHDLTWLAALAQVSTVQRHGSQVVVNGTGPLLVVVAAGLAAHDLFPVDLRVEQPSLEDAYLGLTGGSG